MNVSQQKQMVVRRMLFTINPLLFLLIRIRATECWCLFSLYNRSGWDSQFYDFFELIHGRFHTAHECWFLGHQKCFRKKICLCCFCKLQFQMKVYFIWNRILGWVRRDSVYKSYAFFLFLLPFFSSVLFKILCNLVGVLSRDKCLKAFYSIWF